MSFETLNLRVDEKSVARVTLARPDSHNAMSIAMIRELGLAVTEIESNDSIRVAVLTGQGKSFCAGGDLKWMQNIAQQSRAERVAESSELADMLYRLNRLSKPLVARVNGAAYGGGLGLIACSDISIGVDSARFALAEVGLGLIPANIAPYVVRRIGEANARQTFFNGKRFDAQQALGMNLLSRVVAASELDAAVEEEVGFFLNCPPKAVAASKRLVAYVSTHDDHDNRIYTADRLADAWETDEGREGIRCFVEKQTPPWKQTGRQKPRQKERPSKQ